MTMVEAVPEAPKVASAVTSSPVVIAPRGSWVVFVAS
jgi:hypothetical protein